MSRNKTPNTVPPRSLTAEQATKIRARIATYSTSDPTKPVNGAPCWLWTRATSYGYGLTSVDGRLIGAHRAAWMAYVGPIPDDPATGRTMQIDHVCGRGADGCVQPAHMEMVTQTENLRRQREARTACGNGHPYVDGSYWTAVGSHGYMTRRCRACQAAASRRYKARLRAEALARKATPAE